MNICTALLVVDGYGDGVWQCGRAQRWGTSAKMAALLEAGHELRAPIAKTRKPYCGSKWSRLPGTPLACAEDPASRGHSNSHLLDLIHNDFRHSWHFCFQHRCPSGMQNIFLTCESQSCRPDLIRRVPIYLLVGLYKNEVLHRDTASVSLTGCVTEDQKDKSGCSLGMALNNKAVSFGTQILSLLYTECAIED